MPDSISSPFSVSDRELLLIHLRSESKSLRMAWILNSLLAVVSCNLLLVLGSVLPTTSKSQDTLVFDCFRQDSSDFLTELQTYESVQEVYLRGFVFDGENVVEISKCFIFLQIKRFLS